VRQLQELAARAIGLIGGNDRLGSLFRGSALVMATQVAGIALAYFMQVVIARTAGTYEFGVFAYAWTWMNVIFLIGAFGMNESALRLIPSYHAHAQWDMLRGMVLRGPVIVFALAAGFGLIAAGIIGVLGDQIGAHYRLPLLITFAATPIIGLLAFLQSIGRALGTVFAAFLPRSIGLPVLILLAVAALMLAGRTPDAMQLIVATLVAGALLAVVQLAILLRRLPAAAAEVRSATPVREWLRLSMPLLFITACYGLLTHCDLLMVGLFRAADEVAIYQAASRTAAMISFPLLTMNALVAPMISRLHAEKRVDELQRSVTITTQVVFWPAAAAGLAAIAGGGYILRIFGPAFEQGQTALTILVLGHLINVGTGPVSYLMTMTGHQDRCAVFWAITVCGQFLINLFLIPHWGIEGAAVGTTLATSFLALSLTIAVRRRLAISSHALVPVRQTLERAMRS
jgi:O-antigen/teichoic acid export membrane protein